MNKNVRFVLVILWVAAVLPSPVCAQGWDPEGGDTSTEGGEGESGWAPPADPAPAPAPAPAPQQNTSWGAENEAPPEMDAKKKTGTDHESVVGRLGVGFFGTAQLPIGDDSGAAPGTVSAPRIGGRFWLSDSIAFEGALGFALASQSVDVDGTSSDAGSQFGLAFHVGLPLSFYYGQHYNFILIPEINFCLTDGSVPNSNGDTLISGFAFDVGARLGAEIQFGFIDIPELALQGTVGLGFSYQSASSDICNADPDGGCDNGSVQATVSGVGLGTSVQSEPWDIFTGSIAALYYF